MCDRGERSLGLNIVYAPPACLLYRKSAHNFRCRLLSPVASPAPSPAVLITLRCHPNAPASPLITLARPPASSRFNYLPHVYA
jgi:hypothetical protein